VNYTIESNGKQHTLLDAKRCIVLRSRDLAIVRRRKHELEQLTLKGPAVAPRED
jgi:hypothetical protein